MDHAYIQGKVFQAVGTARTKARRQEWVSLVQGTTRAEVRGREVN